MKFVLKPIPIEATRMLEPFEFETLEGVLKGKAGDWLVTEANGQQHPVSADDFATIYLPCDDLTVRKIIDRAMPEVIEDLFGDGITESEARSLIRLGQTTATHLKVDDLRADVRIPLHTKEILADAIEACEQHYPRNRG